jgi:hypothetical protein
VRIPGFHTRCCAAMNCPARSGRTIQCASRTAARCREPGRQRAGDVELMVKQARLQAGVGAELVGGKLVVRAGHELRIPLRFGPAGKDAGMVGVLLAPSTDLVP